MLGFILRGALSVAVISLVVSLTPPVAAQVRTWTDSTGKFKTQAEFVSYKDGKVTIRQPETEKTVTIPLEKLSEVDKRYLRRLLIKQRSEQRAAEREAQEEAEEAERTGRRVENERGSDREEDLDDEEVDEEELDEEEDAEEEDRLETAADERDAVPRRNVAERQPTRPAPRLTRPTPNNFTNSVRGAVYRVQVLNNLRQISLALINYESKNRAFPTYAIETADGEPGLSWRVAILPMIGEQTLYRQFKLDEPWDSPTNKKLVSRMPSLFKSPGSDLDGGYTNYLAVVGPNTVIASGDTPVAIRSIVDGTSNTIMLVEADDSYAAIWTKPDDYVVDSEQPLYGLGGIWSGIFYAGMADGSVHRVPASADADSVNAWFGRDDGNYVPIPRD